MNNSNKKDIIAIGNALVDVFIKSDLDTINSYGVNHNSMNLIDENKKNQLHNENKIHKMVAAGSAGNTIVGVSSFGGSGTFIGKISNDKIGKFFIEDINNSGIDFPLGTSKTSISTGCCTIFVENNGNRTMCTYLGTGSLINDQDINHDNIINHKICYLEGYLWDNAKAKQAMKKMVDICKADKQKIAFTLSDLFCVDRHRDSFNELIKNDVDILFGNQDEFSAMVNSTELKDGIEYAKSLNILSIITLAENGSMIVNNDSVLEIKAEPVSKIVDTTGAGDLFAAGFLYGLTHQKSLGESGRLASIAAAEIISHFGVRPQVKLSSLI